MTALPQELRDLIESGPMAHLATLNADGSPQVTVIWIGLDGEGIVSGHMNHHLKLRNVERDPRVVLSFDAPAEPGTFLNPYAALKATATIEPGEHAWELLNRLAKVYVAPDTRVPRREGHGLAAALLGQADQRRRSVGAKFALTGPTALHQGRRAGSLPAGWAQEHGSRGA